MLSHSRYIFLLTEGGVKKSISPSQILLAHQKTHPPYLHLAAQISFCEKGPPIPTSPSSPPCSAWCSPYNIILLSSLISLSKTLRSCRLFLSGKKKKKKRPTFGWWRLMPLNTLLQLQWDASQSCCFGGRRKQSVYLLTTPLPFSCAPSHNLSFIPSLFPFTSSVGTFCLFRYIFCMKGCCLITTLSSSQFELFLLIMHMYLSSQKSPSNKKFQNSWAALHFPSLWRAMHACPSGLEIAVIVKALTSRFRDSLKQIINQLDKNLVDLTPNLR